jgi:hypothetical protein
MESTESFIETTTNSMSTNYDEFISSSTESIQETTSSSTEIITEIISEFPSSTFESISHEINDQTALIRFSSIDYVVFGVMLALSGDI